MQKSELDQTITIDDVARTAGVSVSTISRILNNKPDVSPATRARVLDVIHELGFTPHVQATRLAAGKSHTIALLFPPRYVGLTQLELDFFIGAAAAAMENSYSFNLVTADVTQNSLLGMYRSGQVEGVILMQIQMDDWRVNLLRENGLPFVMIGRAANNTGLHFIDLDFEEAVLLAYEHLNSLGHRNIGFIARPAAMREENLGPAIRSLAGCERACAKYAIPMLIRESEPTINEAFTATESMLREQPALTAIVTANGISSVGVIRAAEQHGRHVPIGLSVVAVATRNLAQIITPPLTAIDFPTNRMGFTAADMLIQQLMGKVVVNPQILLAPNLIVQASAAPAP